MQNYNKLNKKKKNLCYVLSKWAMFPRTINKKNKNTIPIKFAMFIIIHFYCKLKQCRFVYFLYQKKFQPFLRYFQNTKQKPLSYVQLQYFTILCIWCNKKKFIHIH